MQLLNGKLSKKFHSPLGLLRQLYIRVQHVASSGFFVVGGDGSLLAKRASTWSAW